MAVFMPRVKTLRDVKKFEDQTIILEIEDASGLYGFQNDTPVVIVSFNVDETIRTLMVDFEVDIAANATAELDED